jgi:hypothetical protein
MCLPGFATKQPEFKRTMPHGARGSLRTQRWRGVDSNLWYRGALRYSPISTPNSTEIEFDRYPAMRRFAADSMLEEAGFKPSVPPAGAGLFRLLTYPDTEIPRFSDHAGPAWTP